MDGQQLIDLIGRPSSDPDVQACLDTIARGMRPELDPDDAECCDDWIVLNEIGLKLGFDDEAHLRAWDESLRRQGEVLLSHVWIHAETADMQAFPGPLPFGLTLCDDAQQVRGKLAAHESTRRFYLFDSWRLPGLDLTVAYRHDGRGLEWLYCRMPEQAWPPRQPPSRPVRPEEFKRLFGLRWSSLALRSALSDLGLEQHLAEVRKEHVADLRREHGLELYFKEGRHIPRADPRFPKAYAFSAVTYYAERELDSRQWTGPLPFGLDFGDTQRDMGKKIGVPPALHHDVELSGYAVWHFADAGLNVVYSNLENRLLRITLMAPGFWPR